MKKLLFFAAMVAMLFATSCKKEVNPPDEDMNPLDNSQPGEASLCFTAVDAGATVQFKNIPDLGDSVTIQYLLNGTDGWTNYTSGNTITLANAGDKVYFRASANHNSAFGNGSLSRSAKFVFGGAGYIAASGDIMSLYGPECPHDMQLPGYAFGGMFEDCKRLTKAPKLPATKLGEHCYLDMFTGCESLTEAPELPAETIADGCYINMFGCCINLTDVYIKAENNLNVSNFNLWLMNVGSNGTLHCTMDFYLAFKNNSDIKPDDWKFDNNYYLYK